MTIVSCLAAWMAARSKGRRRVLWAVVSALPLMLVSALRWNIGTDYSFSLAAEYDALKWVMEGSLPENVGLLSSVKNATVHYLNATHLSRLYLLIAQGLLALGADVQWLFVVFAVLTLGCVCVCIYRQSEHPAFAIFLFVFSSNFFLSLNIMRQYMAISLCLLAYEPAQKRRPLPFLLLVGLAVLFHQSALVFLPVYLLTYVKIKPKWSLALVIAALAAAPLVRLALERVVPVILPKYAWYFSSKFFDRGEFETMFLLINLAVLALAWIYYERGKDKPYFRLWFNSNLLGTLFLCFSAVVPLMKRINYYYAACHFLFIPMLANLEEDQKRRRILIAAICVAFVAETVIAVMVMNKNGVYPYTSIFDKEWVPYYYDKVGLGEA